MNQGRTNILLCNHRDDILIANCFKNLYRTIISCKIFLCKIKYFEKAKHQNGLLVTTIESLPFSNYEYIT